VNNLDFVTFVSTRKKQKTKKKQETRNKIVTVNAKYIEQTS